MKKTVFTTEDTESTEVRKKLSSNFLCVLCVLCGYFLFSGCSRYDPWSVKYIENSSRLCYHSADKLGGIDIEMLKTEEKLTSYLQIRSGMLETEKAVLIAQNKEYFFTLDRHRGGQRFNIPEEMQTLMINLLNEEIGFAIKMGGYKEKIEPGNFKKKFKNSNYTIPFHLPF